MFTRIRNMHPLGIFAAGVVATLVLRGTAMAITDTSFTYSTVQTGYYTIHPADVAPSSTANAAAYNINPFDARLVTGTGPDSPIACFTTGFNLPQLSKLTTVGRTTSAPPATCGPA